MSTSANTQHVKATVARALIDPSRLVPADGVEDAKLVAELGPQRLALLAGFLCKVRNNDIWEVLPLTRNLIRAIECEIALFATFTRVGPDRALPPLGRAGQFVAFLDDHLSTFDGERAAIRDLARHEHLLAYLSNRQTQARPAPVMQKRSNARNAGPRLAVPVTVQAYSHDPLKIASVCEAAPVQLADLPPAEDTFLCYVEDRDGGPARVFRIDPAVALVLQGIDGNRSVTDIARAAGQGIDESVVAEVLRIAAAEGLIDEPADDGLIDAHVKSGTRTPARRRGLLGAREATDPAWDDALVEILAGHARARLLHTLACVGVLDELLAPQTVVALASRIGLDEGWLGSALQFTSMDQRIVRRLPSGQYVLSVDRRDLPRLRFELRKFVGAYGPGLDSPEPAATSVDDAALAVAFAELGRAHRASGRRSSLSASILAEHNVRSGLLDLGCGPGDLLLNLAERDAEFRGVGIDANPAMCAAANAGAEERGVAEQVSIHCGDARSVIPTLAQDVRDRTTAIYAASFFNALFGSGQDEVVAMLRTLRSNFGGRLLFVDDYYGQLGAEESQGERYGWAVLQDVAQVTSGQGIPPCSHDAWRSLYQRADCGLERAYEGTIDGIPRFVHVVELRPVDA